MIKNERQYRVTKAQAERFEQALEEFRREAGSDVHPLLRKAEQEALESQLEELRAEVREYEDLVSGKHVLLHVESLADLPSVLIKARIAQGLTQAELASRLGMKEQQIQRYEATDYESATLKRLQEVSQALGLKVSNEVYLPATQTSPREFLQRIREIGLEKDFVMHRLLPASLAAHLEANGRDVDAGALTAKAAAFLARVFDWTPADVLSPGPLHFSPAVAGAARFKMPANAAERRVTPYTVYAHYLALVVLQCTKHLSCRPVPRTSKETREAILAAYGSITIESVLGYVWDLGIPVLPLKDSGGFHGACWRSQGRNVIVLKQRTSSSSRLVFDLLHELRHAGEEADQAQFSVIEDEETSPERRSSKAEQLASQFAGNVILAGKAEQLVERCINEAGDVKFLKNVVPRVARKEAVPVGALANYLAFRLSMEGHNWWGAAQNLQEQGPDPWRVARDILLSRLDLSGTNPLDLQLLMQALSE